MLKGMKNLLRQQSCSWRPGGGQHAGDFFPSMARPESSRRGKRGGGGEMAGMEWGAPGCRPRVQLKPTVTRPSLVERLIKTLPPRAQTERNSDATTNWELDLEVKKSRSQDYFQLLTG